MDDVEHLVGEKGLQDRGYVGEGDLPRVFAEAEVVYPPEVYAVEGNREGLRIRCQLLRVD